ncbi:MAG: RNA polymerase sigma-70 factor [Bacteroidetes bacterium]|nr:MAG: RNA polymerase sigma-70 factor [Bacteroidota bacterium]
MDRLKQYESLFRKNYRRLFVISHRITVDADVTEDIIQDVFLKLWESNRLESFEGSIDAYLTTAVYNRSLNHKRDSGKNVSLEQFPSDYLGTPSAGFDLTQMDLSLLKQEINRAIESLPPQCRTVFVLGRLEEMKYREIAELMDLSIKTVEKHMGKAIRIINQSLKPKIYKEFLGTSD